jgi:hypothetical protein
MQEIRYQPSYLTKAKRRKNVSRKKLEGHHRTFCRAEDDPLSAKATPIFCGNFGTGCCIGAVRENKTKEQLNKREDSLDLSGRKDSAGIGRRT